MIIKINNGYLHYDKKGQGIPILFIHGYPLSREIWVPQFDNLFDQALLLSLDLRGHGDSFPFEGPYTMDLLAADCKRLLEEINIKQPILVCGLSMGGYVTMAMYRRYPQLFRGMILTSTRAGSDSPEGKADRDVSIQTVLEHGSVHIADSMIQKIVSPATLSLKPELIEMIHGIMAKTSVQGIVGALQGMKDRLDSTELLSQIRCPVLIVHGIDDQLIPIKEAEIMHQHIDNSHLVLIDEAGHLPNLEQPERFNQAIRDFMLSLP
jgi:pimeloyl-ACP methyl ester carboxylesterase